MKRVVIFTIIMCLFVPVLAYATEEPETRTRTIPIEGLPEDITETKITGTKGYTIFMDLDRYELLEEDEGGGFDTYVPKGEDASSPLRMSIHFSDTLDYTVENAVEDTIAVMEANGYSGIESSNIIDFPDEYDTWSVTGENDGQWMNSVLIGTDLGIYYATIEYPTEAAEGFGHRMLLSLYSLEPLEDEQVKGVHF